MPIIIACPSCGGKLRVTDELRGQLVRCPACKHTFDSTPANEARPVPQDLPLQLTIDDPSEPRTAPAGGSPGLVGAVEVDSSWHERQPEPEPPRSEPPRRTPPRLDVDWDLPDLRRRGPRRDAQPHRGSVVLTLGVIGLACLGISCTPIGLILGLTSWIMGSSDLRKMKRGDMDPEGQGITQAGWICGIISTLLNGLLTLGCLSLFGFFWYEESNRPRYPAPPPRPAPIQKWQPPPPPQPPVRKFRGREAFP